VILITILINSKLVQLDLKVAKHTMEEFAHNVLIDFIFGTIFADHLEKVVLVTLEINVLHVYLDTSLIQQETYVFLQLVL
jgi:hypothetical protein